MLCWKGLAKLPPDQLARQDIAEVNLACADGLPLAEQLDHAKLMDRLDFFVRTVRRETTANWKRFRRNRYNYRNSEAYFAVLVLITTLQRHCGVSYNLFKIEEDAIFDTADSFIFGILQDRGGTCATMPVIYVAVGRRLGYPMKLVSAYSPKANHLFVRWDDGRELFNIEATARGLRCPSDDHYRTGRYRVTPEIERDGCFLQSKTPRQELATFLSERTWALRGLRRYRQAADLAAWATTPLVPENKLLDASLQTTLNDWSTALQKRRPAMFPTLRLAMTVRRFPSVISMKTEWDVLGLEAMENLLNDPEHDERFWEPMRSGRLPWPLPNEALVDHDCLF